MVPLPLLSPPALAGAAGPPGCDHAASSSASQRAYGLGRRGAFHDAIRAYTAASNAVASCPASDRGAHVDAYVEAAHAVIAGAALVASTPRGAAEEAVLVSRATSLRALVDLRAASPTRLRAVQEADGWLRTARALPQGPITPPPR